MHCSMNVKVYSVVCKKQGHGKVEIRTIRQAGGQGELASGPEVAQYYLYTTSGTTGGGCHQSIVLDLGKGGVDRVHLVLVQFLLDW